MLQSCDVLQLLLSISDHTVCQLVAQCITRCDKGGEKMGAGV